MLYFNALVPNIIPTRRTTSAEIGRDMWTTL